MCGSAWNRGSRGAGRSDWGWGFGPWGGAWFGARHGRRHGGPFRGSRLFEQGDLKYVILKLLAEKPRHGYEIIKELSERFGGAYSPSAGTVYPTLALLEDMGFASVTVEESGRKVYAVTEEGRRYLEENRGAVEDIFERITDIGASFLSEAMMEVNRAFGRVARATYATAPRHSGDPAVTTKIREILDEAARRIEELGKGTGGAGAQSGEGRSES